MITDSQNIVNAVYTKITQCIGTQCSVYELEAPQDTELPLAIFSIITDNITSVLHASGDRQEVTLQVNFYGWKSLGSKVLRELSDSLWYQLHRSNLNILGGVSNCVVGTVKAVTNAETDIIENRQEYKIIIV